MSPEIANLAKTILAVNVAAVVALLTLSFVGSAVALNGLEKLDLWLRPKEEKRPDQPPESATPRVAARF